MGILITGGNIVNEGRVFRGSLSIADDCIESVMEGDCAPRGVYDKEIDATGCFVLPGVIDDHVHFREPGSRARPISHLKAVLPPMAESRHTSRCPIPIRRPRRWKHWTRSLPWQARRAM